VNQTRLVLSFGVSFACLALFPGCNGTNYYSNGAGGQSGGRSSGGRTNSSGTGGSTGESSGSAGGNSSGGASSGGNSTGGSGDCKTPCNLPGQFCSDAGVCVVCLDNSRCSTVQPFCFTDGGPYYGTCVECLGSPDCSPGNVCDSTYTCVPGCQVTNACAAPMPICADSGLCVSCLSAADCIGGLICKNGICSECTDDQECLAQYANLSVCSPENNCVQCRQNSDCPAGDTCVGFVCQQ